MQVDYFIFILMSIELWVVPMGWGIGWGVGWEAKDIWRA